MYDLCQTRNDGIRIICMSFFLRQSSTAYKTCHKFQEEIQWPYLLSSALFPPDISLLRDCELGTLALGQ